MSATIISLRGRVETILADASNDIWSSTDIDEGIRQALAVYSKARPYQAVTTLTVTADSRELDVSSITGLLNISRIWLPYTASAPEHPPNWRAFEHWQDLSLVYFPDETEPQTDDVARLFYTKLQTVESFDGATTTTFSNDDETLIARGSAGYAALARARDATETVMIDANVQTAEMIMKWAQHLIGEFMASLGMDKNGQLIGSGPGVVTIKRLTREAFYDEDYPLTPGRIPA